MLAFRVAIIVACILSGMAIAGCQVMNRLSTVTTTDAEGVQDDLHAFGRFDPPPPEIALMDPRPAASVQVNPADAAAADELSALLRRTERFDVLSEGFHEALHRVRVVRTVDDG